MPNHTPNHKYNYMQYNLKLQLAYLRKISHVLFQTVKINIRRHVN